MAIDTVAIAFKFITLLLIDVVALVGNALILLAGLQSSELRKYNNIFIFNAAFADVCQSIFIIPFGLVSVYYQKWPFSNDACHAVAFVKVVVTLVSVQSLAGISLDRYYYIVKCKRAINSKLRSAFFVILVWFNASICAVAPFFGWGQLGFDDGKMICTILFYKTVSHTITVFTIGLFVPVLIMLFCYYKIFKVMHANGVKVRSVQVTRTAQQSECSENNKESIVIKFAKTEPLAGDSKDVEATKLPDNIENSPFYPHGEKNGPKHNERKELGTEADARLKLGHDAQTTTTVDESVAKTSIANKRKSKPEKAIGGMTQKEFRLFKTIALVVVVFIACWLPYVIFNLLRTASAVNDNNTMDTINMWMGFVNSSLNPLIYGVTNRQFRNEFKKILRKLKKCSF
eukprot:gene2544-2939_t